MDVDGQALGGDAGAHVSNTSSLDRVEDLLPELLPDVSVFSQLFGPSSEYRQAPLAAFKPVARLTAHLVFPLQSRKASPRSPTCAT